MIFERIGQFDQIAEIRAGERNKAHRRNEALERILRHILSDGRKGDLAVFGRKCPDEPFDDCSCGVVGHAAIIPTGFDFGKEKGGFSSVKRLQGKVFSPKSP